MNVSNLTTSNYIPYLDLLFYKNKDGNTYVEFADIDEELNIGTHQPLSHKDFSNLVETFKVMDIKSNFGFKTIIPKNVVYYETDGIMPTLAWVVPGKYRPIIFKENEGKLIFPHLFFVIKNNTFKVFAIKTLNIKNDTPLFHAPFPNMYNNNTMCWGTMKESNYQTGDYEKLMQNYESVFFDSRFTGELMDNTNASRLVLKYIKQGMNKNIKFDNKILAKTEYKVKHVILT